MSPADWKFIKVSMVADALGTETCNNTVADILDAIRSGKWANEVKAIRAAYANALDHRTTGRKG